MIREKLLKYINKNNEKIPSASVFFTLDKEEEPNKIKPNKLCNYFIYIAYLVMIIVFIWILCTCKSPNLRFNNEKTGRLDGLWQVTCKEEVLDTKLPFKKAVPANETVIYSTTLPETGNVGDVFFNSIMFPAFHEYVKVYLDGELLQEFGYDQEVAFNNSPNNAWLVVRLPEDFGGKKLVIEKNGFYNDFAGNLNDVFIGTKNALVFYVLERSLPNIFINVCIILLSIGLLISSLFFKQKALGHQLRYLSVFSLVTGFWLLFESGGYQFYIGRPVIISNLTFMVFSLIPLVFVRFLMTYECFREHYFEKILYFTFSGFILIHLLSVLEIKTYYESLFITHIIMIAIILGIIAQYIYMRIHKQYIKDKHLFVSCFVLTIFALTDIIRFYLGDSNNPTIFSQVGVFLYFIVLIYFAMRKIAKDNENSLSKIYFEKMAYTDILTGLPNRNAFEREMDYYRGRNEYNPLILLADLNGLKVINDNFGHSQGDNAIIQIAKAMSECFTKQAHIFRIGGDEFCAIFEKYSESEIVEKIRLLHDNVKEKAEQENLPISIAAGWYKGNDSVDKIFNKADANMYENKKQIKNKIEIPGNI